MLAPPPAPPRLNSPNCALMPNRKAAAPPSLGIEVWVSTGAGDEASWREAFQFWKSAGVTHVTVNSAFERNHHRRIASRSLEAHLTALERCRHAVADLF
jgi:hypothetical protein